LDLRQSRDSGPRFKNAQPLPRLDKLALRRQAGPWTYQAHIAGQNVVELRKLINLEPAQIFAERSNRRFRYLVRRQVGRSQMHRPQFVTGEKALVFSHAGLLEYRWARTLDPDSDNDKQNYRPENQQEKTADQCIEQPLHSLTYSDGASCLPSS
jgi:hypothetical protein